MATKSADAITTAVGLRYVPGIVEVNPIASAVFAGYGTVAGLVVLSVGAISVATVAAELLAIQIRRQFATDHLVLFTRGTVYGTLSVVFGAVTITNAMLLVEPIRTDASELLVIATVAI